MIEIILGIGILLLLALNVYMLLRLGKGQQSDKGGQLELLSQQLNQRFEELSRTVDTKVGEGSKSMQDSMRAQLTESARIVKEVTEGLTKLDETNRQVVSFADQLQHLQDILRNTKQRGALGEYYLETVLRDVFPPSQYTMQYSFENGEIVDAALFLQDKILPIDSKFSLENYERLMEAREQSERETLERAFKADLKKRIDETAKYVRPQENTMEFAFMFIPSEAIYYDLLANKIGAVKTATRDLISYAFEKKVIIVSPTSFVAYLQTVMQGLKSLQIEEQARDIQKRVGQLGKHLGAYNEFMLKLGNALATTVNHYNKAHKELGKVDKDVLRITGESPELETLELDRPHKDE